MNTEVVNIHRPPYLSRADPMNIATIPAIIVPKEVAYVKVVLDQPNSSVIGSKITARTGKVPAL